jgi:hypothetical protein
LETISYEPTPTKAESSVTEQVSETCPRRREIIGGSAESVAFELLSQLKPSGSARPWPSETEKVTPPAEGAKRKLQL